MSAAYETWCDRLDSGRLTKSQCGQFAQAISRQALGLPRQGRRTALTDSECEQLYVRLQNRPTMLTPEHTDQGLTWLARHGRKALDMPEDVHDDVVTLFSHFSWDGEIHVFGTYDNGTLPVWTVHLSDGRKLRYFNAAWQGDLHDAAWWWDR